MSWLNISGIEAMGGHVIYKANVSEIVTEGQGDELKASAVRLADGRVFRGRSIISNATRWDTFEKMMGQKVELPEMEKMFRWDSRSQGRAQPGCSFMALPSACTWA